MNIKALLVLAVAAVAVSAGCLAFSLGAGGGNPSDEGTGPNHDREFTEGDYSDWNYWLGNMDSPGVSDAKTPISLVDMVELWKVSGTADSSSINWKTPGSAICVGSYTYYYNGTDNSLRCVETSTGEIVRSVTCYSDPVYNMAIAYGDGKIFIPCSVSGNTVMKAFDAETLGPLFISESVRGSEVQGAIIYHEGYVYFGTYDGDFACFSSEDADPSRWDEVTRAVWILEAGGWYNSTPAFAGDYCILASGGYSDGGTTIYVLDRRTGAVHDAVKIVSEYCSSGITMYDGRAYAALNRITDVAGTTSETNTGKTLRIHSFIVTSEGSLTSEKIWTSSVRDGGTQSTPVICNSRLYIGGGGSTMGSSEPFTVIEISPEGDMETAYTAKASDGTGLCTKSTASLTVAYASEANGYSVYIYLIEYGRISESDSSGLSGSADIYVLRDCKGQTSQDTVFSFTPSVRQFAYQSFTISSEGYLLIRNDSTLFCYGHADASETVYTATDVKNAIDRILESVLDGSVGFAEVEMVESRYSNLPETEKADVTNYSEMQSLYRTVTFVAEGSEDITVKALYGSLVNPPQFTAPAGEAFAGWYTSGGEWVVWSDRITDDTSLTALYVDTVKVTFDADGGSGGATAMVAKGGIIGYVADPLRPGYTFAGWFSGSTECVPCRTDAPLSDIVAKARWLKNCTVTFDSAGGSPVPSSTAVYSLEMGHLPIPSRSGYTFAGWYLGSTEVTSETVCIYTGDVTLEAMWVENAVTTVDNGNGISVTACMPEDSVLYVSKAYAGGSAVAAMKELADADLDCIKITVSGEGVTGDLDFIVSITVGASFNGMSLTAYSYTPAEGAKSVEGTVSGGVLSITTNGDGQSSADIVIGISAGTEMYGHI